MKALELWKICLDLSVLETKHLEVNHANELFFNAIVCFRSMDHFDSERLLGLFKSNKQKNNCLLYVETKLLELMQHWSPSKKVRRIAETGAVSMAKKVFQNEMLMPNRLSQLHDLVSIEESLKRSLNLSKPLVNTETKKDIFDQLVALEKIKFLNTLCKNVLGKNESEKAPVRARVLEYQQEISENFSKPHPELQIALKKAVYLEALLTLDFQRACEIQKKYLSLILEQPQIVPQSEYVHEFSMYIHLQMQSQNYLVATKLLWKLRAIGLAPY